MTAGLNTYCYGTEARELNDVTFIVHEGGLSKNASSASDEKASCTSAHRSAVLSISFAIVFAFVVFLSSSALEASAQSATDAALDSASTTVVYVRDGESLWSIAQQHGVDGVSTQSVVDWIVSENNLSSSCLFSGQKLVVPA